MGFLLGARVGGSPENRTKLRPACCSQMSATLQFCKKPNACRRATLAAEAGRGAPAAGLFAPAGLSTPKTNDDEALC